MALIEKENSTEAVEEVCENLLTFFMYALKAPETRRQWPRSLKVFFDFLEMEGASSLEVQARLFVIKTRQRPPWAQDNLIRFMTLQRERVWR